MEVWTYQNRPFVPGGPSVALCSATCPWRDPTTSEVDTWDSW